MSFGRLDYAARPLNCAVVHQVFRKVLPERVLETAFYSTGLHNYYSIDPQICLMNLRLALLSGL